MKEIKGDLIELAKQGKFDVIVHGCNCFNTMGSGIAPQIKNAFPEAWEVDQKTSYGDYNKLGTFSKAKHGDLTIVNAYTQYRYGRDKIHLSYDALRQCLKGIKSEYKGKRIGLPLIGAGLGGGDWKLIKSMIDDELEGMDITIVHYKKERKIK